MSLFQRGVTGYGFFLPVALLGALAPRAQGESGTRPWFTLWIGMLVVLLIGVHIDQVKLASGAQIPLAILAMPGDAPAAKVLAQFDVTADRFLHVLKDVRGSQRVQSANPEATYEPLDRYELHEAMNFVEGRPHPEDRPPGPPSP